MLPGNQKQTRKNSTGDWNLRRFQRIQFSMPVYVVGRSVDGQEVCEVCRVRDVSIGGLRMQTNACFKRGEILYLVLPMPRKLRRYDRSETFYETFAEVKNVRRYPEGGGEAGLFFLGKEPIPSGYEDYPKKLHGKDLGSMCFLPEGTSSNSTAGKPGKSKPGLLRRIWNAIVN